MARQFDGTSSNYILLGINKIAQLYAGVSAVSMHLHYYQHNASTVTEGQFCVEAGAGTPVAILLTNSSNQARVGGRAKSTDDWHSHNAGTPTAGAWNRFGGVLDFGNDTIRGYLNGTPSSTGSIGFSNTAYVHDTSTRDDDTIGCMDNNPLGSWSDGHIAEVAIWKGDIGAANFAALNRGVSPLLIRPDLLIGYWPLIGRISPEPDLINANGGTVTGSTHEDHPPVIYPGQSFFGVPSAADVYVTPAAAAALAATVDPSVVLGSISITPAVAEVLASGLDPSVVLGSILVTPAVAEALAATVDPSVVLGSLNITPAVAQALAGTVDPSVILGSVALTPAMAEALAQTQDPGVVLGSLSVTPALALALAAAQDPLVVLGSIVLTPEVAEALALALDPGVTMGSMSVTPPLISALCEALDPNVIISGEPAVPHMRSLNLWWTFGVGGRR